MYIILKLAAHDAMPLEMPAVHCGVEEMVPLALTLVAFN
jgi:hypothetical protein